MGNIAEWRSGVTLFVIPPDEPRRRLSLLLSNPEVVRVNHTKLTLEQKRIPFNFVTAPFFGVIFLLAIQAIGGKEIEHGIIGSNSIHPIDIMAFFLALAYMAISLDATGLIRYSAWWVLNKAGGVGHRLYFLLYLFFFCLGTFIGNDPIILSGTAFLAYLTRVASNIEHPRAWIFAQFSVANVASAILVSSNPTNLVLAGAFKLKFVTYTINMIVPVLFTAAALFPFLLYIVFPDEKLIPLSIEKHELPTHTPGGDTSPASGLSRLRLATALKPGSREEKWKKDREHQLQLPLEELVDPFLEVKGALFGGILIATTLTVLLAVNATGHSPGVYAVTVPAAFVQLCRDVLFDLLSGDNPRRIAPKTHPGSDGLNVEKGATLDGLPTSVDTYPPPPSLTLPPPVHEHARADSAVHRRTATTLHDSPHASTGDSEETRITPPYAGASPYAPSERDGHSQPADRPLDIEKAPSTAGQQSIMSSASSKPPSTFSLSADDTPRTAYSIYRSIIAWANRTLPTVCTVVQHLPFALIPFAFCMFILVEGLVTKGWIELFAKGWAAWANKVGVIGCIGGMGFVSVCLCNFAGTNIGATILLSRVLQAWLTQHTPSDRMRDATIYALALGVNYGAFSATFSASLAGLLWRDILNRKFIRVRRLDFARINVPIIAISMAVGCGVLAGQVYIVKDGRVPACRVPDSAPHFNSSGPGTCP